MSTTERTFTISDALKIQRDQLKRWKTVLNTKTYERLIYVIDERNARGYKSPYDVVRGSDLYSIISNISLQNTGQQDPNRTLIY